ncbi:MAG: DEAD/DEAH box helicase family protein [bacterium]|nr:DEAD/DEAH box helicase family protein [bacterium]
MKRRFNKSEKAFLYMAADGNCVNCGAPLEAGWHADHVVPWSQQQRTHISNGQALCPKCNLTKGSRQMLPAWEKSLRTWQAEAYAKYLSHQDIDFLLEATPGAGKTSFSLRLAHFLLDSEDVKQMFVVCPSDHLKRQWTREASQIGIELDPDYSIGNATIKSGYHGVATTYQQVGNNPDIFNFIVKRKRTAVFFDEIHHAADSLPWGDALRNAFQNASRRIGLSGTPFRGDNNKIPFVHYTHDGVSIPDYSYTYSDSLRDEVCRYVFFPKYEGRMEWISGKDGKFKEASFADDLNEREASERLNTAISIKGDWLSQVLQDAHRRLNDLRSNGHTNAGGLVIAKDQTHAQQIAALLQKQTGYTPVIATSDVPDASQIIEAYRKSSDMWIIAVKMVSEGVDIPRLRVLVYATNVATELFFRQAVGRVIRVIPGLEEQNAFFFIPNDPTLVGFAHAIQEQRNHQINNDMEYAPEFLDEYVDRGITSKIPSQFTPIDSEAQPDGAIFGASAYTQDELNFAGQAGKDAGMPYLPAEVIASFIRRGVERGNSSSNFPSQPSAKESTPRYERERQVKSRLKYLVGLYAAKTGLEHKDIHKMWMGLGGKPQAEASLEELERKTKWIKGLIEQY